MMMTAQVRDQLITFAFMLIDIDMENVDLSRVSHQLAWN